MYKDNTVYGHLKDSKPDREKPRTLHEAFVKGVLKIVRPTKTYRIPT